MKVLILAAGYATRLYPLTLTQPKPLLPVAGKPMIEYVIDNIAPIGVDCVYVVTNAKFADHFYAREQSLMTDYFRGFALAGLITTSDPREAARLFAAGLIYIRLEHYVMGAQPLPRAKVIEAIDRYLAFFLSLIGVKETTKKQQKTKGETRGKAAPD